TGGAVSRYTTADSLERALEIPYRVRLAPQGPGRFYFLCRLDITTLNDTDLEELTRWLKGDVSPAVSGEGNVGGALVRGAQRIVGRLARGPQRVHSRLLGQQVPLPRVTATARGQDVRPGVGPPPRQGHQKVAGQALPVPQLLLAAPAELAAVVVAGEEECVGHLAAE